MPLVSIDTSEPLIGLSSQSIESPINGLAYPWVVATQTKDSSNLILSRSFNEVEIESSVAWSVKQGSLSDEAASNKHYSADVVMLSHKYSSSKEQIGSLEPMSDFKGWSYVVEQYTVSSLYTDILVKTIVWSIYDEAFADELVISSPGSTGVLSNYSDLSLEITSKGAGARIQASSDFTIGSGDYVNSTTFLLANGLESDPQLLHGNKLFITRPAVTRVIRGAEDGPPILKKQIIVKLYGKFWAQNLELVEMYDQGYVMHPDTATSLEKLKPPGKQNLNDSFPDNTSSVITGLKLADV